MKNMLFKGLAVFIAVIPFLISPCLGQDNSIADAIATIKKVDVDGKGHDAAVEAIKVLNAASAEQIPEILAGMDGANKLAINWMRSAVVSIAGRADKLPTDEILAYFENKEGSQLGRLMAFDLLNEAQAGWAEKTIDNLIDDPSLPLRHKAVKSWIVKAKVSEPQIAIGLLGEAVNKARDVAQVQEIREMLGKHGINVDLQKQLGFINTWHVVGTFDNKDEGGFDVVHGPENDLANISLDAKYTGVEGKETEWSKHSTVEPTGVVDLNDIVGKVKGVTVYALGNFKAEEDRDCEIRVGCINAHKVWVNGELVMSNEVYHNGISPDKFSGAAKLVKGDNRILIKVCQNEQTEPWAQRWQFQVRVCDETGKAIEPAKPVEARF